MSERPLKNILVGRSTTIQPSAVRSFAVTCEILAALPVLVTVFLDVITGTASIFRICNTPQIHRGLALSHIRAWIVTQNKTTVAEGKLSEMHTLQAI
jgi:hypothetical protein